MRLLLKCLKYNWQLHKLEHLLWLWSIVLLFFFSTSQACSIAEIFKNTQSYFRNLINIKIKQEILIVVTHASLILTWNPGSWCRRNSSSGYPCLWHSRPLSRETYTWPDPNDFADQKTSVCHWMAGCPNPSCLVPVGTLQYSVMKKTVKMLN